MKFEAKALGVKDYLPASLDPSITDKDLQTGVSFGSAGSGFDPQTSTLTLKRNNGEEAANNIITNSVVVVIAGNNDLLVSRAIRGLQNDIPAYANMLVKHVMNFTQEIYKLGVKRIVVFSAPPIGCLPALRTLAGGPHRTCVDEENNAALMFNNILKQQLQFWAASFPQSRVAFTDYYNPLISIIENPKKYGFDVADKGCCGTGAIEVSYACNKLNPTCPDDSNYFFWDSFHLSEKGNNIVANLIIQDLVNTTTRKGPCADGAYTDDTCRRDRSPYTDDMSSG
ncbi:hypothetical protein L1987_39694 [Smallanthus sonchifolius]|uniref:Uncharacterized protein n=1 Tax=Smallanthus sonchifolius TaxID=185202 RepID=A0ACB9HP20_9ASTR|nr:hypothetical protein L1987_39694 [Smallanthus sonchifolius]